MDPRPTNGGLIMAKIHKTSTTSIPAFKKDRYVAINSGLSKETIDLVTQYALFDELQRYNPEAEGLQVPGAHSKYGDPMMESLLLALHPTIEKYTGLKLFPTYSYYRVYHPGDKLDHHVDRPSCEVSLTISFEYDYKNKKNYKWPIYIDGTPIALNPGEMAIYRGCELDHWRDPFDAPEGSFHVQAFLHYVDQNGPNAGYKNDGRESVGVLGQNNIPTQQNTNQNQNTQTKSYIEYTR